tara:strand:- start:168 stop:389 length:222 start_codon:yes stop_codon:yes gene_type:complete
MPSSSKPSSSYRFFCCFNLASISSFGSSSGSTFGSTFGSVFGSAFGSSPSSLSYSPLPIFLPLGLSSLSFFTF